MNNILLVMVCRVRHSEPGLIGHWLLNWPETDQSLRIMTIVLTTYHESCQTKFMFLIMDNYWNCPYWNCYFQWHNYRALINDIISVFTNWRFDIRALKPGLASPGNSAGNGCLKVVVNRPQFTTLDCWCGTLSETDWDLLIIHFGSLPVSVLMSWWSCLIYLTVDI